ncbi:MAG: AIR synthase-related protein, partial [Pseudomonadota bacterium]
RIVELSGMHWDDTCPWDAGGTLGSALLTPTRLYVKGAVAAIRADAVHGLAHITGGGLTENVPRMLPEGMGAEIDLSAWALPPVFGWLAGQGGLAEAELLKTFNAGIGMVAAVAPDAVDAATAAFADDGHAAVEMGRVVADADGGVRYTGSLK